MRDPIKRTVAILAVLLPVTTITLLVFKDAVRESVVVPLLYLAWLGELTFNSIHQAVFWGLLLALTVILLYSSVRPKPEARLPRHWASETDRREGQRVAFWARQLARDGNELLWDFQARLEFRKLILVVWAYRRRVGLADLEQKVKTGVVELPPKLRTYFENDRYPHPAPMRYVERAVSWLRALTGRDHAPVHAASESALDEAVHTLEAEFGADGGQPGSPVRGMRQ